MSVCACAHAYMCVCVCVTVHAHGCMCVFVCEIQQQIYLAVDETWLGGHPFTDSCYYTFVMCYMKNFCWNI